MPKKGTRERKILLTAFHCGVPGVPNNTPSQLKIYPNYVARGDSLDLDPAAVLPGTGAVFDRTAFDYMREQRFLRQMNTSLSKLQDSGRLELVSYSDHIKSFEGMLHDWLERELAEDPEKWRYLIMAQLAVQNLLTHEQAPIIGPTLDLDLEALPSGLIAHLTLIGDRFDLVEAERIMKLLRSRRRRFSRGEAAQLREVARPYLAQAGSDLLLSERLDVTLTPWGDLQAFYDAMAKSEFSPLSRPDLDRGLNEECLRLFSTEIPEMRPEEAHEIVAFQSDRKAVQSLLAALRESVSGKRPLTRDQVYQDLRMANYRLERAGHMDQLIKLVSIGARVALGAATFGIAPEALELVGERAIELIDKGIEGAALGAEEAVVPRGRRNAWISRLNNIEGKRVQRRMRRSLRRRIVDRIRSLLRNSRRAA